MRKQHRFPKFPKTFYAVVGMVVLLSLFFADRFLQNSTQQVFAPDTDGGFSVSFLDVGQGDSILIRTVNGNFVLIDAGTHDSEAVLKANLDAADVETISYAVFTHPHEDHIGGADMVVSDYTVSHIVMSDAYTGTETYKKLLTVIDEKKIDTIMALPNVTFSVDGADFTLLSPADTDVDNLNNASIVIRMEYENTSFLFAGDAEYALEKEICKQYKASALHADVLKLGHHGSDTSSTDAFLDNVSPSVGIISCGKDNDYGHPHTETLQKLEKRHIDTYRTDLDGTVIVYSDGTDLTVRTQKSNGE